MTKRRKNTVKKKDDFLEILYHPHDKYFKLVMENRVLALQLMEWLLPEKVFQTLDLSSFQLSNQSYIDEKLHTHFADICYSGLTKEQKPCKINFLFEHKSDWPNSSVMMQLNRYIISNWNSDIQQNIAPVLCVPILIYHGSRRIKKETAATIFPEVPPDLLAYVPTFDYITLDIARLTEQEIDNLRFLALRNIIRAFKYSRDEKYLVKHWQKILIFAPEIIHQEIFYKVIQATIVYMVHTSKTVNKKLQDSRNELTPSEHEAIVPFIFKLYRDSFQNGQSEGIVKGMEAGRRLGMEVGMEKGMEAGMEKGMEAGMEKGMEAGMEKGMEVGMEKGMEVGMEKGMEAGMEKGMEVGMGKGMEAGMEVAISHFIKKHPEWNDQEIADTFVLSIDTVKRIRAQS